MLSTSFNPLGVSSIKIDTTPVRFNSSSSFHVYQVPAGCKKLQIDCVGAKGYGTNGGKGGRVYCILSVSSKQVLYVYCGSSATAPNSAVYNASDIRTDASDVTNSASLNSRLLVAGGGGNMSQRSTSGGNGGGLTGANGSKGYGGNSAGKGGTQSSGGSGGTSVSVGHHHNGRPGSLGLGGNTDTCGYEGAAGAGGAGYYGGGGGAGDWNKNGAYAAGGGGGSSYTNPNLCSEVIHTQGYNSGNGYVIITPMK